MSLTCLSTRGKGRLKMKDKLKILFFAVYFFMAPWVGYHVTDYFWSTRNEADKYSSYIDGIERGKWVYVIDVHQPKVWADGEHDDAAALQKIIERGSGLNPKGVRPAITWFSEARTHLIGSPLSLSPPSIIIGARLQGSGTGTLIQIKDKEPQGMYQGMESYKP